MKPIPVEIVPSHVYLSAQDQATLFGVGHPMTVASELSQAGQYAYEETLEVFGRHKRSIRLHVLGPNWDESHVELTPTEATVLGIDAVSAKSGDLSEAAPCRLVGPAGEVNLQAGVIIPKPHLLCSPEEAEALYITNGKIIPLEMLLDHPRILEHVIVRVHPTFRLRLEIHQDIARSLWITRPTHAKMRS